MAEHPHIKLVRLFRAENGDFFFIGIADNDLTIVESSEGYRNKEDAEGAIHGVFGDEIEIEDLT